MALSAPQHLAVIGAGMAGIACARTLVQAGHTVQLFEKSRGVGGRMATR
ncbi:MAG: FAD-dependent oxidoreductase, partial [Betaproteobacteria bacterium]|nr:FAD-dependent oxidoreductase [Betaproteobacteria bacterium]